MKSFKYLNKNVHFVNQRFIIFDLRDPRVEKRCFRGTASGFNLLPHNSENPAVFCTNDFSANWDA